MRTRRSRATGYGSVQQTNQAKARTDTQHVHSLKRTTCAARIAYIQRRSLLARCIIIVALIKNSHSCCEPRLCDSVCRTSHNVYVRLRMM